ncbi:acVLRF1 family peptidyl-tRNA hydrolase [Arthrobacter sp. H14-L1]|uniref:acVLRF1 family peptidyl-tRNA hydrolase n=1 Tax=Arthrobacter sp. H14-L1 TaxID=2996697 RepID=UPI00226D7A5F|nr:acVLRF1 family peptidyl-tRNA hydrolase [Arthrobacter sp. H14-L1]MCY0903787.1 acVLRF1 family peptidyl-tRNA hydrolase [Arthrobacter sp. H14-L1]
MATQSRTTLVSAERLPGWAERFAAAHGALRCDQHDDGLHLSAADGSTALLHAPWPAAGRPGRGATELQRLASLAAQSRTVAVVLIRSGGYALGLCRDGEVLVSKAGSGFSQSRSGAGGSSQQRSARRRVNQADAMLERVAEYAQLLFRPQPPGTGTDITNIGIAEYLVLGGDRALTSLLMAEPRAAFLARLPQLRFLDVPDPKAAVLKTAAREVQAIRIRVTDS